MDYERKLFGSRADYVAPSGEKIMHEGNIIGKGSHLGFSLHEYDRSCICKRAGLFSPCAAMDLAVSLPYE